MEVMADVAVGSQVLLSAMEGKSEPRRSMDFRLTPVIALLQSWKEHIRNVEKNPSQVIIFYCSLKKGIINHSYMKTKKIHENLFSWKGSMQKELLKIWPKEDIILCQ
jgi:hypothetical protein